MRHDAPIVSAEEIRLVVNADDFGMSAAISRGILRAHREGIVTSTSLLGNAANLPAAKAMLSEAPNLGVGVHLALCGGPPVAAADTVRSLLAPDGGLWPRGQDFIAAWLTRRQLGARRHGPQSWGYVEAGHLDAIRILEIIGRLGPGPHELICHPGETADEGDTRGQSPRYHRTTELASLTSAKVRRALEQRQVTLCRWGDLF